MWVCPSVMDAIWSSFSAEILLLLQSLCTVFVFSLVTLTSYVAALRQPRQACLAAPRR